MPASTHILYLHGFRSSPQSFKAQMLAGHLAQLKRQGAELVWCCPQLPPSPADAWALIQQLTASWPTSDMVVIGSSLGGFYATVLAEQRGCRCAVINPAVEPARDLARYIGEQTSFHNPDDHFFFRPEFIEQFKAIAPYPITRPERYWALIAKGDEVLSWPEMAARYQGAQLHLLEGSDHAVSDFAVHQASLLEWLGLPDTPITSAPE
ncbi:MAG TPA: YqiA/YcfP family alpha/beta fold hydrolase [Aquabacterium sp.]|uniref:YqiA/YcfP family alpha/beta fold hydrolase n=1 Tax=Aquabacterium sp. TaxID=1872578 RepID=UPI002E3550D8|nr:YqiA/YcfP family alpha/beta fold hydrolase [Aquabacterium sp.]HEX5356278.1 YqiA/YcfP family alpha/beta fold hydrolase [Aquabacterium sp.]